MPSSTVMPVVLSPTTKTTAKVTLIAWDPESEAHAERLFQQRIACGWKSEQIEKWRALQREGKIVLQWVVSLSSFFMSRMLFAGERNLRSFCCFLSFETWSTLPCLLVTGQSMRILNWELTISPGSFRRGLRKRDEASTASLEVPQRSSADSRFRDLPRR